MLLARLSQCFSIVHDIDNPHNWLRGIAYKDEIICGCCGSVFEISEVCELSEGYVNQAIYEYDCWIDLNNKNDSRLPNGLINMTDEYGNYIIEKSALEVKFESYKKVF